MFDDVITHLSDCAVPNTPPVLEPVDDMTNTEGESISFNLLGTDAENQTLTYSASTLPDGISLDPSTGLVSGTLTHESAGVLSVTFTVIDSRGGLATTSISWTVADDPSLDPPVSPSPELLYVASSSTPNANDQVLVTHLQDRGIDVTVVDDEALPSQTEIIGYDFAWISSTVVPTNVGDHFTNSAIPVGLHEAFLYDDMNLATSQGQQTNQNGVRLADDTTVTTTSQRTSYSWATPVAGATILATQRNNQSKATVFTIDEQVELVGGTASPQCRAGFFAGHDTPSVMRAEGFDLFDQVIDFLQGCSTPNTAPQLSEITDQTSTEGDSINLAFSAQDSDDGATLVYSSTQLPSGLTLDPSTGVVSGSITYLGANFSPYTVDVSVTDNRGAQDMTSFTWQVANDPSLDPPVSEDPNVLVFMTDDQTVEQMRWLPSVQQYMASGTEYVNSINQLPSMWPFACNLYDRFACEQP